VAEVVAGEGLVGSLEKHRVFLQHDGLMKVGVEWDLQRHGMGAVEAAGMVAGRTVVEGPVEIVDVVVLQEEDVPVDLEMIDNADLGLLEFDRVVGNKDRAEE
jgi:hypothetical protein